MKRSRGTSTLTRRLLGAVVLCASAGMGLFALGRQKGWREALSRWLCEPEGIPAPPGFVQSVAAAGIPEWLVAIVFPCLLVWMFLSLARFRWSLVFWYPLLGFHVFNRMQGLAASSRPWGFCGLKRDGVFDAVLIDVVTLALAVAGACVVALMAFVASRRGRTN